MRQDSRSNPPRFLSLILGLLLSPGEQEEKSGDLEEVYRYLSRDTGRLRAGLWYLVQLLKVTPRGILNHVRWSSVMFKNYLRIAWHDRYMKGGYYK